VPLFTIHGRDTRELATRRRVVVSEGPSDKVRVRSEGLRVVDGGAAISAVYEDELRRTDDGWRIARHAKHVK